jgi:hypothetical protein
VSTTWVSTFWRSVISMSTKEGRTGWGRFVVEFESQTFCTFPSAGGIHHIAVKLNLSFLFLHTLGLRNFSCEPGLPDGIFEIKFWYLLEVLWMEILAFSGMIVAIWCILCHLIYFVVIWYIWWSFGIFCGHIYTYFVVIWYILTFWICLAKEKSGKPDSKWFTSLRIGMSLSCSYSSQLGSMLFSQLGSPAQFWTLSFVGRGSTRLRVHTFEPKNTF